MGSSGWSRIAVDAIRHTSIQCGITIDPKGSQEHLIKDQGMAISADTKDREDQWLYRSRCEQSRGFDLTPLEHPLDSLKSPPLGGYIALQY